MGAEEESVEQAAAARRERLRALKTAKELLSTPVEDSAPAAASADAADHEPKESDGGVAPPLVGLQGTDGREELTITDEDTVSQAVSARQERLKALKAAKELLSAPDNGSVQSGSNIENSGDVEEDKELTVTDEDTVSQAVSARHERLRALKAAKELLSAPDNGSVQSGSDIENSGDVEEEKRRSVKFRNYLPHDKQLQEHKLAPPVLPKFEDPVAAVTAPEKIEDPFVNIAPKKPNWDLRRDVQKKLDKLERRTQKALYQLYTEQEAEREALENREAGPEN